MPEKGDKGAMGKLYRAHVGVVYRCIYTRVGDVGGRPSPSGVALEHGVVGPAWELPATDSPRAPTTKGGDAQGRRRLHQR